ncbi:hypothetical protein ACSFBI_01500 [Variovorax sp. RB3P1]|uniref:hypothetical protein n=1 Tax=Variovorax sp. RB3P1 TaxID=3443732 RepID=UPI003F44C342
MIDNTEARRHLRETGARKMPAPSQSSTDTQRELMFNRPHQDQYKARRYGTPRASVLDHVNAVDCTALLADARAATGRLTALIAGSNRQDGTWLRLMREARSEAVAVAEKVCVEAGRPMPVTRQGEAIDFTVACLEILLDVTTTTQAAYNALRACDTVADEKYSERSNTLHALFDAMQESTASLIEAE